MTEIVTSEMNNETKKLNVVVDVDNGMTMEYLFKEQERQRKMYGYSKEEIIEIVREVLKEERDKSMKDVVTRETMERETMEKETKQMTGEINKMTGEINKMTGEINKMTGEINKMTGEKSK